MNNLAQGNQAGWGAVKGLMPYPVLCCCKSLFTSISDSGNILEHLVNT